MQKQRDRPKIAEVENNDATVAGTTAASKKFLESISKGSFTMNTTVSSNESQVFELVDAIDFADVAMEQLTALIAMMGGIARLSVDADIQALAIHAKQMLTGMHNDADVLREQVHNHILAN